MIKTDDSNDHDPKWAEEKQRTLENGQAWRSSNEGTFEMQKN
jgi:hypothetical protein